MVPLNRSGYAVSPFGGRPKRNPKMVSLNRPGHAVAPFGGRLFGARPEWFWCDIVAKAKSELASGWGDMYTYVKNGSKSTVAMTP